MKVALIGSAGNIGSRILQEALNRGHQVTAIWHAKEPPLDRPKLTKKKGDVHDPEALAQILAGHDAVIASYNLSLPKGPEGARSIVEAVRRSGVKRLLWVGGAGTMDATPGTAVVDMPSFPAEVRPHALPMRDFYNEVLKNETVFDWTFFGPAVIIQAGERTGKFRVQADLILQGSDGGPSRISYEDYAVAMVDELEKPSHSRKRFTIAY